MAILIQQLENVINILDTSKSNGEQILQSLTLDSTAFVVTKPNPQKSILQFRKNSNLIIRFQLDGTLMLQDLGGAPYLFTGTADDLINHLNNKFFIPNSQSYEFQVASGSVPGSISINKFGKFSIAASGIANNDIVDVGGIYVPPTDNRIHQIKSTSAEDAGVKRGDYVSTTFGATKLIDSNATFIADGVAVGDVVMNDTNNDHTLVVSVVSETEINVRPWHHEVSSNLGDSIRIAGLVAGKTGVPVIHITNGYSVEGVSLIEFVIMNGVVDVPTTKSYFRINRMHQHGSISTGYNIGTITATADVDSTITAQISIGNGQTEMAFQHVPIGSTGYLYGWDASIRRTGVAQDAMAGIQLLTQLWGNDGQTISGEMGISVFGSPPIVFATPKEIGGGTDLWIRCIDTSDNNTIVTAHFDIVIKNN
jgi:hypothetical protein